MPDNRAGFYSSIIDGSHCISRHFVKKQGREGSKDFEMTSFMEGPQEEVFVMSVHRSNSHEPLGKFDMVSNNQGSVHLWAQMKHEMAFGAN